MRQALRLPQHGRDVQVRFARIAPQQELPADLARQDWRRGRADPFAHLDPLVVGNDVALGALALAVVAGRRQGLDGRPPVIDSIDRDDLVIFDRWILSRLENTIESVDRAFAEYRLSAAAKTVYNFVWDDYCSWYIELIKPDQPGHLRTNTLNVATYVLHQILRLLHPFVPFVTEEILQQLTADRSRTLTFGPWPQFDVSFRENELEARLIQIQNVVTAVRSIRSELSVPPGKKSDLHVRVDNPALADLSALGGLEVVGGSLAIEGNRALGNLAGLEKVSVLGGQVEVNSNGSLADSLVQTFGRGLRERGFAGTFSSGRNGGRSAGAIAFADPRFEQGARAALGRYDNLPLFWEELQRVRSLTVRQASSLGDLALFLELRRLTLSQPSATDYSSIAACTGLGVDNLLVELSGGECPGMDGSAGPFAALLDTLGIVEQAAPRAEVAPEHPVAVAAGLATTPHERSSTLSLGQRTRSDSRQLTSCGTWI